MYIELGGSHSMNKTTPTSEIIHSLMNTEELLDRKMKDSRLQLVTDSKVPLAGEEEEERKRRRVTFEGEGESETDGSEDEDTNGNEENDGEDTSGIDTDTEESANEESEDAESDHEESDNVESDDDDDEDIDSNEEQDFKDETSLKWKENLLQKAAASFMRNRKVSLQKLIYSNDSERKGVSDDPGKDELGGMFVTRKSVNDSHYHQIDSSLTDLPLSQDWCDGEAVPVAKDYFVTGSWGDLDAQALLDEDEELYGDFEDYETGLKTEGDTEEGEQEEEEEEERERKKKELKKAFDVQYDNKDEEVSYFLYYICSYFTQVQESLYKSHCTRVHDGLERVSNHIVRFIYSLSSLFVSLPHILGDLL